MAAMPLTTVAALSALLRHIDLRTCLDGGGVLGQLKYVYRIHGFKAAGPVLPVDESVT